MDTIYYRGFEVKISRHIKPQPVIKTSPDFKWCSEEFRAKHDAWLLEMFGTEERAYMANNQVFMSETTYAALRMRKDAHLNFEYRRKTNSLTNY